MFRILSHDEALRKAIALWISNETRPNLNLTGRTTNTTSTADLMRAVLRCEYIHAIALQHSLVFLTFLMTTAKQPAGIAVQQPGTSSRAQVC